MNCPCCDIPLEIIAAAGLELDQCPECWGVWFDEGELRPFVSFVLSRIQVEPNRGDDSSLEELIESQGDYDVDCPVCNAATIKYIYGGDSCVVLDFCESCNGIWVDKPEVPQLAAYLQRDPIMEKLSASRANLAATHAEFGIAADSIIQLSQVFGWKLRTQFYPWRKKR